MDICLSWALSLLLHCACQVDGFMSVWPTTRRGTRAVVSSCVRECKDSIVHCLYPFDSSLGITNEMVLSLSFGQ